MHHLISTAWVLGVVLCSATTGAQAGQVGQGGKISAPDALIYQGPGACDEGCSEAAALMAKMAGLNPVYVGPSESDPKLFTNAVVWIQPGGQSRTVGLNMSTALKDRIREFVYQGGAYVGFCAGGFYATAKIGELDDPGLGLIAGTTALYGKVDTDAAVLKLTWAGKTRDLYWEGGPAFYPPTDGKTSVEVMATYPDGSVSAERASYGEGRVYVTGVHPEAPQWWRDYYKIQDPDGLDYDLAVGMIQWAARVPSSHRHPFE